MNIFLICITFPAGIVGIYFVVSWYSRFVYKLLVTDKLSAIDEVMDTGEVPVKWRRRFHTALMGRTEGTVFYDIGSFTLKKLYLRRLRKLVKYIQHNPRMNADEKESYLLELGDTLKDWTSRNIKQLL